MGSLVRGEKIKKRVISVISVGFSSRLRAHSFLIMINIRAYKGLK